MADRVLERLRELRRAARPAAQAAPRAPVAGQTRGLSLRETVRMHEPLGLGDAWDEVLEDPSKLIPWIGSIQDAREMAGLWSALKRIEEGAQTPEDEDRVLQFYVQASRKQQAGYIGGKIVSELPAFAGEFAGSLGLAKEAGKRVVSRTIREAIEQAASKAAASSVVGRAGVQAAQAGVGIAAQMALTPQRVVAEAYQRALPEVQLSPDEAGEVSLFLRGSMDEFLDALPPAIGSMAIEYGSERTGGLVERVLPIQALQVGVLKAWLAKHPSGRANRLLDMTRNVASATRWDGAIAEVGEERIGDLARAVLLGDPLEMPGGEQWIGELAAMHVPMAAQMGAVAATSLLDPETGEPASTAPPGEQEQRANVPPPLSGVQGAEGGGESAQNMPEIIPDRPPESADGGGKTPEAGEAPTAEAPRLSSTQAFEVWYQRQRPEGEPGPGISYSHETEDPELQREAEFLAQRGVGTIFTRREDGEPQPFAAAHIGGWVLIDEHAAPDERRHDIVLHELSHHLREFAGSSWEELYRDVEEAVPQALEAVRAQVEERYGALDLDEAEMAEERLAHAIGEIGQVIELVSTDPGLFAQAATTPEGRGFLHAVIEALKALLRRLTGAEAARQPLEEIQQALVGTAMEDMSPQLAGQLALRMREALDTTFGARPPETTIPALEGESPASEAEAALPGPAPASSSKSAPMEPAVGTEAIPSFVGRDQPTESAAESVGAVSSSEPAPAAPAEVPTGGAPTPAAEADPNAVREVARRLMPSRAVAGEELGEPDFINIQTFARLAAWKLIDGKGLPTMIAARRWAKETMHNIDLSGANAKRLDEALELGAVLAARVIIQTQREAAPNAPASEVFEELVELYKRMPKLGARTSKQIELQAFSTPVPIAYLASRLAQVEPGQVVMDPAAGNGALLLEVEPSTAVVNELDPVRAESLRFQGFDPSVKDALEWTPPAQADVLLANPPFGKRGEEVFEPVEGSPYQTKRIDHAMILRTLQQLKEGGRAVLVYGHPTRERVTDETRKRSYNTQESRAFHKQLYDDFHVLDHFTISGKLYTRQGASWPIDVVVLERTAAETEIPLPGVKLPRMLKSFDELQGLLDDTHESMGPAGVERDDLGGRSGQPDTPAVAAELHRPDDGPPADAGGRGGGASAADRGDGGKPTPVAGDDGGVPERVGSKPADGQRRDSGSGDRADVGASDVAGEDRGRGQPGPQSAERGRARDVADAGAAEAARPRERVKADQFQVGYKPASQAWAVGTQTPRNMQGAIRRALESLSKKVGDIDAWVAEKLGYTVEEVRGEDGKPGYFSAEQIDALALAVMNHENGAGFIIGDQTGVGKGRVVAGMMVYAKKQGLVPVFVTANKGLYGDIHRDLHNIGRPEIALNAFATNSDMRGRDAIPLELGAGKLEAPPKEKMAEGLAHIQRTGQLPEGYDALFTSYSQLQYSRGEASARHAPLAKLARNAFFVLDESHKAGGTGNAGWDGKTGKPIPTRAQFVRDVLKNAGGVLYSSATYAKNEHVMSLYYKTDMGAALEKPEELPQLLARGGVPLKQVVANMLAESGQYVRRERTFEGISFDWDSVHVPAQRADRISNSLRAIFDFDLQMVEARKVMEQELLKAGDSAERDSAVGLAGAHSTTFAALMHNIIGQTLMALKADQVVRRAVEAHRKGNKPIIALSNTMGAFLGSYVAQHQIAPGGGMSELTFNRIYINYLERTRRITRKDPVSKRVTHIQLTDEWLKKNGFGHLIAEYKRVEQQLERSDMSDLPGSPIDYMLDSLEKAGVRVGEITGRDLRVEQGETGPVLAQRNNSDATKKRTMAEFNNGELDALIFNQAVAEGFSLHSAPEFEDRRPRWMFVLQPEPNIDTFTQILGRINRTGQVNLPRYSLLATDVPAERRPAAVLMRKMAGLSASTTASRDSAMTLKGIVDFMNPYGDRVVLEVLQDERQTALRLGIDPDKDYSREEIEGLAAKVTGRLMVLDTKTQARVYRRIEDAYTAQLASLDALGENGLEAKTLELDAKVVEAVPITRGKARAHSVFARPAFLETLDVKRLSKPPAPEDVAAAVRKAVGAKDQAEVREVSKARAEAQAEEVEAALVEQLKPLEKALKEARAREGKDAKAEAVSRKARIDKLRERAARLQRVLIDSRPGMAMTLVSGEGETVLRWPGVVVDVKRLGRSDSPLVASDWLLLFQTAESAKPIQLPLSKLTKKDGDYRLAAGSPQAFIEAVELARKEGRETRQMVTGNLLAGFQAMGGKGQIVLFRDEKKRVRQGILVRRSMDATQVAEERPITLSIPQAMEFLRTAARRGAPLHSGDGALQVTREGGVYVFEASSKGGKPYYLSPAARKHVPGGEFTQRKGARFWGARVDAEAAQKMLKAYATTLGTTFEVREDRDDARRVAGIKSPARFALRRLAPEDLELIRKAADQARAEGDSTEIGSEPSSIANTSTDADARALQRGVREVRAEGEEVVSIKDQYARARAALQTDYAGTKRGIFDSIREGRALTAEETAAADLLKADAAMKALTGDATDEEYQEAVELHWLYQDARRESARALGVIRDGLRKAELAGRSGKLLLADLLLEPSRDIARRLAKLRKELHHVSTKEERRKQIRTEIARLLQVEKKRVAAGMRALEKAGFNPQLAAAEYFKNPVTEGRIRRIVSAAKSGFWDKLVEWEIAAMTGGPFTQKANIVGNFAHGVWRQYVRRMTEAVTNLAFQNPDAAQLGEFKALMQTWMPAFSAATHNLALAFQTEQPVYERELVKRGVQVGHYGTKLDALHGQAIGGTLGRVIRAPSLRLLQAFDEFFKTMVGIGETHALAYRAAKAEGLVGEALENRMREILSDPTHKVHLEGLLEAQVVTFTDPTGEVLQQAFNIRALGDRLIPGGFPLGMHLLPFVRTPGKIFLRGLELPFAPIQLLFRALTLRYGLPGVKEADTKTLVKDLAHTALSLGVTGAVLNLLFAVDDDDGLPLITGSASKDYDERAHQYRTVPPYSVKLFGRWWDYRRIEPAAIAMATLADIGKELRLGLREGNQEGVSSALSRLFSSVLDQAKDKTFLQTFGDLYKATFDYDRSKKTPYRLVRDALFTKLVPNVIKQPLRETDPFIRQSQIRQYEDRDLFDSTLDTIGYLSFPSKWGRDRLGLPTPPIRYDLWGRPLTRFDPEQQPLGRLAVELMLPAPIADVGELGEVAKLDVLLMRYNHRVDMGELGPDARQFWPSAPDYRWTRRGTTIYFDEEEYARLTRDSGQRAVEKLRGRRLNYEQPTERDREAIAQALRESRAEVRNEILRSREE